LGAKKKQTRPRGTPVPPAAPGETLQRAVFVVSTAAIVGILMSLRLWMSDRQFPLLPWIDGLFLPFPATEVLTGVAFVLLVLANFVDKPRNVLLGAVASLALLIFLDWTRLQPWMFLYLWLLATAATGCGSVDKAENAIDCMRIAVIGTYLWSGLQKLQYEFIVSGFSPFFDMFDESGPEWAASLLGSTRIAVPVVETAIALALFCKRTRRKAVVAAVAMHVFILTVIGPLGDGSNSAVWPWNVAMAFLVVLLFLDASRTDARALAGDFAFSRVAAIVVFWVLPAASLSGHWDEYLSANLYSESIQESLIRIRPAALERLPAETRIYVEDFGPRAEARWWLDPTRWAFNELNVPAYPEPRIYKRIARHICSFARKPTDVELRITGKPGPLTGRFDLTLYDCDTLAGKKEPVVEPFDPEWVADR
jgi:hypothetical protein